MIRNIIYNTTPIVFHDNGLSSKAVQDFFDGLCDKALDLKPSPSPVSNITFITWRNTPDSGSFEQSLSRLGYSCIVLGQEIKKWNHIKKIGLNKAIMSKIETEYVMACDSHDVVLLDDPVIALNYFKTLTGCKMLCNAEKNHWPRKLLTQEFEEATAKKPFCYLNSGVWIAETPFAKELAEEAALITQPQECDEWDDQGVFKLLYQKHYPTIQIDDHCHVFQSLRDDESVDWFLRHDSA